MKRILVINGVNLNMVGIREKHLYGTESYKSLVKYIRKSASQLGLKADVWQSNCEGKIVTKIQKAYKKADGIIINAGAYTHTSIAIMDALKAVRIPVVEVHLTDINAREDFRRQSYISLVAEKQICGKGFEGYRDALLYFVN